jgi:hypothetical protein
MIKNKILYCRAFSILEYFIRKKNKVTSMHKIFEREQVNILEFSDLKKWAVKWGMKKMQLQGR